VRIATRRRVVMESMKYFRPSRRKQAAAGLPEDVGGRAAGLTTSRASDIPAQRRDSA
jgi:hypothetical protein